MKEIFYWIYFYLKKVTTNDTPATNAYFLACLLLGINIETFLLIISNSFNLNKMFDKNSTIYFGLGLTFVILIVNYFLLFSNRAKIFYEKDNLPSKRRTKGMLCFWLYVIFTFVVLYISVRCSL